MRFRIRTSLDGEYGTVDEQYGDVLRKYGLYESNNKAYIDINSVEELFSLEEDIGRFSDKNELGDFLCHRGIMITRGFAGDEKQHIEIKDYSD